MARAGKVAENIYGALHLGTGEEVVPFVIDWQDSDATICWFEQVLEACPRGKIVLWIDQASHHTSEEVEEWLDAHRRFARDSFSDLHAGRESQRSDLENA